MIAQTQTLPRFDTDALRRDYPLQVIAGRDVPLTESVKQGYWFGPCPMCGEGEDRFKIWPDDGMFWCRRCGAKGDVFQYLQAVGKANDFVGAARFLTGQEPIATPAPARQVQAPMSVEERDQWRDRLETLIVEAENHLYWMGSTCATAARLWLAARGIDGDVVHNHGIGYNNDWRQIMPGYKLPPGLTIPRYDADHELTAVNVYLSKEARELYGSRRAMVKGSNGKSWFNGQRIAKATTVVICEGELDAALLSRFLPPFASSITCGGVSCIPDDLANLRGKRVILALDNDAAGIDGAARWSGRLVNPIVATVPAGKDITDYWCGGGDVREWMGTYL